MMFDFCNLGGAGQEFVEVARASGPGSARLDIGPTRARHMGFASIGTIRQQILTTGRSQPGQCAAKSELIWRCPFATNSSYGGGVPNKNRRDTRGGWPRWPHTPGPFHSVGRIRSSRPRSAGLGCHGAILNDRRHGGGARHRRRRACRRRRSRWSRRRCPGRPL